MINSPSSLSGILAVISLGTSPDTYVGNHRNLPAPPKEAPVPGCGTYLCQPDVRSKDEPKIFSRWQILIFSTYSTEYWHKEMNLVGFEHGDDWAYICLSADTDALLIKWIPILTFSRNLMYVHSIWVEIVYFEFSMSRSRGSTHTNTVANQAMRVLD